MTEPWGGLVAAARALSGAGGLSWTAPWALASLVAVGAVITWAAVRGLRRSPSLLFAPTAPATALPGGPGHLARRLQLVCAGAAAALSALALAGPFAWGEPEPGTTEGIDLVVALDVSGSMRAADFRPQDRLTVAKQVIAEHVLTRPRDRVGLVIFAGEAFTQAPLTHDKALVAQVLAGVRTGVISDGTAIGDGIATSLNRLKDSKAKTRAVILVTDGDNNAGLLAPETATDLSVELSVRIFPILVGRGGKVPFPDGTDLFGAPRYAMLELPVNPALLRRIATRTGGTSFSAVDPESLRGSFQEILDELNRSVLQSGQSARQPIPLAPLLLVPAALLWTAALVLSLTRASVIP